MKVESEELLSQLVDGGMVDPDALAAVLAEPGAAEILVEYARVHRVVLDENDRPSDVFYDRMRVKFGLSRRRPLAWRAPLAAAAVVVLCVLGGMWIGRSTLPTPTVSAPVIVPGPGAHSPTAVATPLVTPTAAPPGCPAVGPPKPHRVVRLTVRADAP